MGGGGGAGGQLPPPPYDFRYFFFCLSAERLVIAMIIPLPHYEKFVETYLKSGKKCVPPPPPPRLSDFFRAGAKCLGSRRNSETFCPPPPPPPPQANTLAPPLCHSITSRHFTCVFSSFHTRLCGHQSRNKLLLLHYPTVVVVDVRTKVALKKSSVSFLCFKHSSCILCHAMNIIQLCVDIISTCIL